MYKKTRDVRLSFILCSKFVLHQLRKKNNIKDRKLIDFIRILLKDYECLELERNPILDFFDTINLSTGELKTINKNGNKVTPSKKAFYNGLEFLIYDTGIVLLSGSLHKYWNNGSHNYNDFNIDSVDWVDILDKVST